MYLVCTTRGRGTNSHATALLSEYAWFFFKISLSYLPFKMEVGRRLVNELLPVEVVFRTTRVDAIWHRYRSSSSRYTCIE